MTVHFLLLLPLLSCVALASHTAPSLHGAPGSAEEPDDGGLRSRRVGAGGLRRGLTAENEDECAAYCDLFLQALDRCPPYYTFEVPDMVTCVNNCLGATFSFDEPDTSFSSDSLQCRSNHALLAIKEGHLTNSAHCIHASIGGEGRCARDEEALTFDGVLNAGRNVFYYPTAALGSATSPVEAVGMTVAAIQFLIAMRGRLYTRYPNLDLTGEGSGINCEASMDTRYRSADGTCNNLEMPLMGAKGTPFTRNTKGSDPHPHGQPSAADVAEILKRPHPSHASAKLAPFNQIAVAWAQFMTHDWFQHDPSEQPAGEGMTNTVTHWWDASQIYGSTPEDEMRIRAPLGCVHVDWNDELDYDEAGVPITGMTSNFWTGLHVLHTIFAREHNYIAYELAFKYPGMSQDELYGTARLCISAILAKIHTLEWTPTLLDNSVSTFGLNINWYGLPAAAKAVFTPEQLQPYEDLINNINIASVQNNDYPDTSLTMFNTSFFMTEEFVAAYRFHPLLPDEIRVGTNRLIKLRQMAFSDARKLIKRDTTETFLRAFAETPANALSLSNYPRELFDFLTPGTGNTKVSLAEIDIRRDRERGIPLYNDARRQLLLRPYTSLEELTDDPGELAKLKSVYDDIEQVDFMVGCLVDKERPEGFAFGPVPYFVFLVMATRRLFSDRFFMEGLTAENYTPWGLNYLATVKFKDILKRHFPALKQAVPDNAFSNDWSF